MPLSRTTTNTALTPVSVTTDATLIVAANHGRRSIVLQNLGPAIVYLGSDATVTTITGLQWEAGTTLSDESGAGAWWGITAANAADVRGIEVT